MIFWDFFGIVITAETTSVCTKLDKIFDKNLEHE